MKRESAFLHPFAGTYTAVVTPFTADGEVDFPAFGRVLELQKKGGVNGVIVAGSTGEGATLTRDERVRLLRYAVEYSQGGMKVIMGTGTNATASTIELTREAKEYGADGVLLLSPYYNKPTQEGLYRHFQAVAEAVDIPQILYNVPGRTASNIQPETQLRIAEQCPNVVAVKEASAKMEQIMEIIRNAPGGFGVLSGDDSLTLPVCAAGGIGVIAVLSNYVPDRLSNAVNNMLAGNFDAAREEHLALLPLMKLNFVQSNPIPVKAILHAMGVIGPHMRLPLVAMSAEETAALWQQVAVHGVERI